MLVLFLVIFFDGYCMRIIGYLCYNIGYQVFGQFIDLDCLGIRFCVIVTILLCFIVYGFIQLSDVFNSYNM